VRSKSSHQRRERGSWGKARRKGLEFGDIGEGKDLGKRGLRGGEREGSVIAKEIREEGRRATRKTPKKKRPEGQDMLCPASAKREKSIKRGRKRQYGCVEKGKGGPRKKRGQGLRIQGKGSCTEFREKIRKT